MMMQICNSSYVWQIMYILAMMIISFTLGWAITYLEIKSREEIAKHNKSK